MPLPRRHLLTPSTALVAALLAASLTGCGDESTPSNVATTDRITEGRSTRLLTPLGAVEVTIGEPQDAAPTDDDSLPGYDWRHSEVEAPDGWTYVPVGVEFAADDGVRGDLIAVTNGAPSYPPVQVEVRAGRARAELPDIGRTAGTDLPNNSAVYVAVREDDVADLRAAVVYDGVRQRIGPGDAVSVGRAAALEGPAERSTEPVDCSGTWTGPSGARAQVDCTITPRTVPYLPGAGWAPKGSVYLAARLSLQVKDAREGRTYLRELLVSITTAVATGRPLDPAGLPGPQYDNGPNVLRTVYGEVDAASASVRVGLEIEGRTLTRDIPVTLPQGS